MPPEDTSAHPFPVLQRRHRTFLTHFTIADESFPVEHDSRVHDHTDPAIIRLKGQLLGTIPSRSVVGSCVGGATSELTFWRRRIDIDGLFTSPPWYDCQAGSWNFRVLSSPGEFYQSRLVINHGKLVSLGPIFLSRSGIAGPLVPFFFLLFLLPWISTIDKAPSRSLRKHFHLREKKQICLRNEREVNVDSYDRTQRRRSIGKFYPVLGNFCTWPVSRTIDPRGRVPRAPRRLREGVRLRLIK